MQKNPNNYIRIKVKTIDSNIYDIVFDDINPSVKEIKKKIEFKLKIPPNKQRLIYQGRVLLENLTLFDYKIENDYVIHLVEQQEFAVNNQAESTNSNLNSNYLGRDTIQNSSFGDIFNMILQTSREINNNLLTRGTSNLNNNNNNNNNLRSSGSLFNNQQQSNSNLINFPELGLGGLNPNLLNFSNLPRATGSHNLFNNNNNSLNSILNNLQDNLILSDYEGLFIPESFKSLEKRTAFNKVESIEVLKQNINNIKELIKNMPNLNYEYFHSIKNIFITNETSMNPTIDFKIGQWVDAKDSLDQWIEAQIMDIKENKVFVHFFGWGNSFNEWIINDSPRLALFRTYTLQSPFTRYYSPFPNKKEDGGLILTNVKDFDNFENLHDLVNFIDKLREKIMKVIFEREAYNLKLVRLSRGSLYNDCNNFTGNNNSNKALEEDTIKFEKINFFSICQLVPMLDRIGRLCSDFSNYMFNYCFNKFENDYEKFRSNIGNDGSRHNLSNYSTSTPDRILNKKLYDFYSMTQIPNMRNPGEVAEAQNLTRPRLGVIIDLNGLNPNNNQTNPNNNNAFPHPSNNNLNNRAPSRFENNRLLITKQPNIEILPHPILKSKKFYFDSYSQTAESSFSKKPQMLISKSDEFTLSCLIIKKRTESIIKKQEEEEKKTEIKNGIHKFYSTGCKKKNDKGTEETNIINEGITKENQENILSDLGKTKTKFSLLKKLSEKNLINIKAESTSTLRESKIEFRETKFNSKPFPTNQLNLNYKGTSKTPVVIKENLNPKHLNNINSNKSLEKVTGVTKDPNKFRRTTSKK